MKKREQTRQRLKSLCLSFAFDFKRGDDESLHSRMRNLVRFLVDDLLCLDVGWFLHLVYHHPVSFIRNYVDVAYIFNF